MFKFVVISDLHLVPEGKLSQTIDTADRFRQAVAHVNRHHGDAEFCVLAGDLADRGEVGAYERLKAALPALDMPCHLTLGNHDDHLEFAKVFGKVTNDTTGCHDHIIDHGGQRIIIMDSVRPGGHSGELDGGQIAWLDEALREARKRPVIVILHHNITRLMVSTDGIRLKDKGEFLETLAGHPDLRHVISGHVHMNASGVVRGVPFTTFSGNHYNIEPRVHDETERAPRHDGPGQYAVVWTGKESTIVLAEDFMHRQIRMPREAFNW